MKKTALALLALYVFLFCSADASLYYLSKFEKCKLFRLQKYEKLTSQSVQLLHTFLFLFQSEELLENQIAQGQA